LETIDNTLIKYDILSVEALDKIHNCLDLLSKDGLIEQYPTLRETYEKTIGVYNLERDNKEMWKLLWNHKVQSLFQMEKESGIKGIALLKPESVDELAILNSTIRLMAQEKGGEMPTEKLTRFKQNPNLWIEEMDVYGIKKEHQELLKSVVGISYGLCIAQEQFMQLVQLPELGGFSLTWADSLRKSIAKKNPAAYEELSKEFFKITKEKGCDQNLCNYVWNVLIAMSKGYGFNQSHTLAYSIIGLQELNLAYKYPIIYWNCACLISDSGGQLEQEEEEENYYSCVEEDNEGDNNEEKVEEKKKKNNSVDYGKIATAIGQIQSNGIIVSPPNINKSSYTFIPDTENNQILYGIKGISNIGDELVDNIIKNRPYTDLQDFQNKVKINKTQMVNLIKSGAFDCFGNRIEIMYEYINSISETKTTLNLRNMQKIIEYNLVPREYEFEKKVFNFNKYIKKNKVKEFYYLDEVAFNFYEKNFDIDGVIYQDNKPYILQTYWDKIYKKKMDILRNWIKNNLEDLLKQYNHIATQIMINKYAKGSISKWEMDSISFYYHEHELKNLKENIYDVNNFFKMPEEPEVERTIYIKDKPIPLFKLNRIAGTVLEKDKNHNLITVLTNYGVVKVKIYRPQFTKYDKQISVRGEDGKKHVIEKSWFSRGNKLIITGIKRDNCFVPKIYKSSPYNTPFFLIDNIDDDGYVEGKDERLEV
jgi:DNA polymerase-3 subunit alpha